MKLPASKKLIDLITNKSVLEYHQLYEKTQWYTREQIDEFKARKLILLLQHSIKHVPFYRNYFKSSIHDWSDPIKILRSIPILDKQTILLNYNDFIPDNLKVLKGVKKTKTSGTTGRIFELFTDSATRSSVWGSFERFYSWMGKRNEDITFNLKGNHIIKKSFQDNLKYKVLSMIDNTYIVDAYKLDELKAVEYYYWLKKQKYPVILRGYSQNIFDLARILDSKGLSLSLKAVTTTAEQLLISHRNLFNKVFNCPTFDQYGCGEVGGIAYECPAHKGLHITEERVFFETNDLNELILTDLDNMAFPLIRYKNGDIVNITDKECICGRKSAIIKEIQGRISDNVIGVNGNHLHWGYFHHLFIDSGIAEQRNLIKFQVIQNTPSEIEILVISDSLKPEDEQLLSTSIIKVLGQVRVIIRNVTEINAELSGKFKAVISKINQENWVQV